MKKDFHQLEPIRAWMNANASEYYISTNTMYYMFGGPDFLYAHAFFPNANTYILAGLEPVGQVPDLSRVSPDSLDGELNALRGSMSTVLKTHYFITKDMRTDLTRASAAPSRSFTSSSPGAAARCSTPPTSTLPAPGVKITFVNQRGRKQTLYYFKTDLSGGGKSPFLKWCAAQGPGLSLLKAASYLMHSEGFNGVRNFLLERSLVIVQDDSGIPLRSFPKGWTVNCYGRYVPHAEMFGKFHQPDLAAIYRQGTPASRTRIPLRLSLAEGSRHPDDGQAQMRLPWNLASRPAFETAPLLFSLILGAAGARADPTADATAKFLAGLPVRGTPLEKHSTDPGGPPTRPISTAPGSDWTKTALQNPGVGPAVPRPIVRRSRADVYMFSGPDFLYANAFFPNASTYILCGIEPVGPCLISTRCRAPSCPPRWPTCASLSIRS